jgi:predicted nucleic acid-binding protein
MHAIDTTMLLHFFRSGVLTPKGKDGTQVTGAKDRVDFLIETLEENSTRLIVPTPVLSEVMVRATGQQMQEIQETLDRRAVFQVMPFDTRAAIELALMIRKEKSGRKRVTRAETRASLRFDRQILAIAKVNGARLIYSDDGPLADAAKRYGLEVVRLEDLELPPISGQTNLQFDEEDDDET